MLNRYQKDGWFTTGLSIAERMNEIEDETLAIAVRLDRVKLHKLILRFEQEVWYPTLRAQAGQYGGCEAKLAQGVLLILHTMGRYIITLECPACSITLAIEESTQAYRRLRMHSASGVAQSIAYMLYGVLDAPIDLEESKTLSFI